MGKRQFEQFSFDDCSHLIVNILTRLALMPKKNEGVDVFSSTACIETHLASLSIPMTKPKSAGLANELYALHETLKRWSENEDAWYNPEYKVL